MYNSSMSITSNGILIPSALVPNKEEFTNNQMEYDLTYPGVAGADKKNTVWTWKARKITKNEDNIVYGDYIEKQFFDSEWTNDNDEQLWAVTHPGCRLQYPTSGVLRNHIATGEGEPHQLSGEPQGLRNLFLSYRHGLLQCPSTLQARANSLSIR